MQLPPKIERWIKSKVIPHRLMLTGREDAFEIALEIATQLQNAPASHILNGTHPDTLILRDNGVFRIGEAHNPETETIRGMIRWAHQKPTAPYRIIVFENFERVFHSAIHATLKLLEEPPARTIFIMTTENPYRLLDTIISRVTVVRLPRDTQTFQPNPEIKDFLEGKDLLSSFAKIEELDKQTKGKEKIDRTPIIEWLDQCIDHARNIRHLHHTLDILLETRNAITGNLNIRFTLERLALKLSTKT